MSTLLDVLTGLGVALAVGLRPFLPALVVGLLALADLTLDFDGTDLSFLESPVVLVVLAVLGIGLLVARDRLDVDPGRTALLLLAAVIGALYAAGALADHSGTWWPGLLLGAVAAVFAARAADGLLAGARRRLDEGTRATLPLYVEAGAIVLAVLSVLLPPVGALALLGFGLLLRGGRRREGEKYAGLRILR